MKPHPLYVKAAAGDWLSSADVARLIRDTLARKFPATRFYVRSDSYAGGSSVDVYYDGRTGYEPLTSCHCQTGPTLRDGDVNRCTVCGYIGRLVPIYQPGAPTQEQVEAIAQPYSGQRFDGMIDMAYGVTPWLLPDGSAAYGRNEGTGGQHGSDPGYSEPRPEPGAVGIRTGSYVFVRPELPYDVTHRAEEDARKARARERKAAGPLGGWRNVSRIVRSA